MAEEKQLDNWNKNLQIIIPLTIICIVITPIVVSDISGGSPQTSGTIGDTIGGSTAPIIGLLSALLLYISFRAQIQANKTQLKANLLIQSQWEFDSYTKIFNDIQNELANLKYTLDENLTSPIVGIGFDKDPYLYQGSEALSKFVSNMKSYLSSRNIGIMDDVSFIIEELCSLISVIEKSSLPNERKLLLFTRINKLYVSKIQHHLSQIEVVYKFNKELTNDTDTSLHPYYISRIEMMKNAHVSVCKWFEPSNVVATIEIHK